MLRGRILGGCTWILGGLALLQTLYLRALPPPGPGPRPPPRGGRAPRGVLDASGSFRVYRDVLGPPPGWARAPRPELVLATHGSPGRAAAALGGPWGGPRVPGGCTWCWGRRDPPPKIPEPRGAPQKAGGCRGALGRLEAADPPSYTLGVPYPGNLLRNVAWEGAAGGGPGAGGGPPPEFGERFVLMVDADVVPSPGLRRGFLRLLRDGGLGNRGGWSPKTGGDRTPKTGGLRGSWGTQKLRGLRGIWGTPKVWGVLVVAPGSPTPRGAPEGWGGPNAGSDPGFPEGLGGPKGLRVPEGLGDLGVPSVPKNPKGPQDPGDPNPLSDPKVQTDPHALSDPSVRSDPNTLSDPHAPGDPHTWPAPSDPPWSRVLFVLPAFEVRSGLSLPRSKAELLALWGRGDARPFYGALCPRCQAPTDFGRWGGLPPPPRLRVAYEAPWRDPWEPFFVAPARGVPPFDERFLQYGFNRISQACELHVAGFRFAVLDGAFVTHRGFKEPGGFHGAREAELGLNRGLFRAFRRELRDRYPGSPRRC
ncbi:beta-1,4-glucuronyltransferase 1 [Chamaea fasciata]|uniref:beta-1,4-glucuronyltransferase 1 n=1 Tax=Chamaea fasciata TaxID=190680 RepID=UPI00336ADF8E